MKHGGHWYEFGGMGDLKISSALSHSMSICRQEEPGSTRQLREALKSRREKNKQWRACSGHIYNDHPSKGVLPIQYSQQWQSKNKGEWGWRKWCGSEGKKSKGNHHKEGKEAEAALGMKSQGAGCGVHRLRSREACDTIWPHKLSLH